MAIDNCSNEQLAYVAGIVDGEGCISVTTSGTGNSYSIRVQVGMCHKETMQVIVDAFGTKLAAYKNGPDPLKHSIYYFTCAYGKNAVPILKKLLPYLITKRDQAILCLEFMEVCLVGQGVTPTEPKVRERRAYHEVSKELNHGGVLEKLRVEKLLPSTLPDPEWEEANYFAI